MSKDFTVEKVALDEQTFVDVFEMLIELHREGGYAPMDVDKTSEEAYRVMAEEMTFVAREPSGMAIGTLGLFEPAFWYSSTTFLTDRWVYVRPPYRGGRVGIELMRAARREAERRGKLCFIQVDNPDRPPKRTKMTLAAQIAGFVPLGYALQLR